MDGVYGWIRNLTGFFLFMSVIDNLLPNKKYGKYVRLFSGMVLILLVLQPLTGSLRLEDRIAHYYESFVFRYQADDLQTEILGIEKQRLSQMIEQYEHAVAQDVGQMAGDMGFTVRQCDVSIDGNEGTEAFGMVTAVSLKIALEGEEVVEETAGETTGETAGDVAGKTGETVQDGQIVPVEPVVIGDAKERDGENVTDSYSKSRGQIDSEVGKLRRKIASYYSLEEAYVEIQIVEG